MYSKLIHIMKQSGVEFDIGLSDDEIQVLQNNYEVIFPDSLKNFYKAGLPISKGFYNWRDSSCENVEHIKYVMSKPIIDVIECSDEIEWCDLWGVEIVDSDSRKSFIKNLAITAPKLIPFFYHRYIVSGHEEDKPVLSICGTDIIYYGKNLIDYIYIEFNHEQREFTMSDIKHIPFWSDLI